MKSLLFLLDFIILSTATSVRLRGFNSSPHQGRVEVYHNGAWGTICDDGWGDDDATVICRMLNFRKGGRAFRTARFGKGNGSIWLDDVNCTSDKPLQDISDCQHNGWGNHNCGHGEDAVVVCTFMDIHLANGRNNAEGLVQVYHNGAWGTICDDSWTSDNSRVVCRQLGYRDQGFHTSRAYGNGTGTILMDDVNCSLGYIPDKIWDCSFSGWGVSDCRHNEDIRVACASNDVKLVNGSAWNRGRVEILQNDQWGTVCDNGFGREEARAVCQMVGYRDGTPCSLFGAGTGTIHVDNLECPARHNKQRHALVLGDICAFDGWGINSCSHLNDVGVWCFSREKEILLVDGTENSGRISVYDGHSFGSLCYGSLDATNADVLCRSIGYRYGGTLFRNPNATVNSTTISRVQNLQCGDTDYILSYCNGTWGTYTCPSGQDIWIDCITSCDEGKYGHLCTKQCHCKIPGCNIDSGRCSSEDCLPGWMGPSCSEAASVRLRGVNSSPHQGRVEVYHNGSWGTICDDDWGDDDATVICRMLNFRNGGRANRGAHFGKGNGQIWLDNVNCTSDKTLQNISECEHNDWGKHDCDHGEDAGVSCTSMRTRVRLRGFNSSPHQGRVEVYHDGAWGTICDDGWGDDEATVICQMMNFGNGRKAGYSYFRPGSSAGSGQIWLDDVNCTSDKTLRDISDCQHNGWGNHNCNHKEDVVVKCNLNAVRLRGVNSSDRQGRVEVYHDGAWGTICDDGWGDDEATVICQMLNFPYDTHANGGKADTKASFGAGSGQIWLDDVNCTSDKTLRDISECQHNGWGNHNCKHGKDAGVVCSLITDVLADNTKDISGFFIAIPVIVVIIPAAFVMAFVSLKRVNKIPEMRRRRPDINLQNLNKQSGECNTVATSSI